MFNQISARTKALNWPAMPAVNLMTAAARSVGRKMANLAGFLAVCLVDFLDYSTNGKGWSMEKGWLWQFVPMWASGVAVIAAAVMWL